jgi:glyoxylase-like metal-dependent hydrolase (beta-lactamase superfamily II)
MQYAETEGAPERCVICEEERQYVNAKGQMWTTLSELRATHHNRVVAEEPGLTGIGSEPSFAIGQRALVVQAAGGNSHDFRTAVDAGPVPQASPADAQKARGTGRAGSRKPAGGATPQGPSAVPAPPRGAAQGGVLWDCISLVDNATVEAVRELGGIRAIAISHPHFYSSMVEWSRAFGGVPIYLHAADRQWVMRPDAAIHFWDGETFDLGDGLTLIRCGGHFAGSTALHWAAGAEGRGALLTSDTLTVVSDRRYLSFLYSYPNLIPLPAAAVQQIARSVEPFAFDRIYGGWFERVVPTDAKGVVARSAERYVKAVSR